MDTVPNIYVTITPQDEEVACVKPMFSSRTILKYRKTALKHLLKATQELLKQKNQTDQEYKEQETWKGGW